MALDDSLLEVRHNLAALLCGRRARPDGVCSPAAAPEALSLWQRNLAVNPDYLPSRLSLARAFAARAESKEAIEHYREFIERQPDYVAARLALAALLLQQDQPDLEAAATQLQAAVMLQPNHYATHERLGDLERRRGNASGATTAYEAALSHAPDNKTRKRIRGKMATPNL
jgi:tetratricopeptide (TPR) repeat protein